MNNTFPYLRRHISGPFLRIILTVMTFLTVCTSVYAAKSTETDSLFKELDGAIANRNIYLTAKENRIENLKKGLRSLRSDREVFSKNELIISEYESFVCDSAKKYLRENIEIASRLRDTVLINKMAIRLALVYAMGGQFLQSKDILDKIDYNNLPDSLKALYGWAQLKFLGNLIISTDEQKFRDAYQSERIAWRDSLIDMFSVGSDLYRKEIAGRAVEKGNYKEALTIYMDIFGKEVPDTHEYAMVSKGIADIFGKLSDDNQRKRYLLFSSMADIRQAVKENESLLELAEILYREGDVDRAYRYMNVALDDANFYNSRFKNAVIARIYPIVEMSYLEMLDQQQHRMKIYIWCLCLLVVVILTVALLFLKQTRVVSRSRADLAKANQRLERASVKLAEANLIRERYVGYFMHQCSINVDKLDKFRINVNRKIKANQIEDLYVLSSRPLEKELEELYDNFDKAFLNLYPNFIEEFNGLLLPEYRFTVPKGSLNTPLRIFALIRLGITDMAQIANFLHYSVQTVYNYKSKVRKSSPLPTAEFEEKVKKIGTLAKDNLQ